MEPDVLQTELVLICDELQAPSRQFTVGKEYPAIVFGGWTVTIVNDLGHTRVIGIWGRPSYIIENNWPREMPKKAFFLVKE